MKTTKFLLTYLDDRAKITISNDKGSILYTGTLGEMPIALVRNSTLKNIEGLGSEEDIIITIIQY